MFASGGANLINRGAGNVDRAVEVDAKLFAPFLRTHTKLSAETEAFGICRDKRFGKKNQLRPSPRRIGCEITKFGKRARHVKHNRGSLNDGSGKRSHKAPSKSLFPWQFPQMKIRPRILHHATYGPRQQHQ